jgi:hypothetical protein
VLATPAVVVALLVTLGVTFAIHLLVIALISEAWIITAIGVAIAVVVRRPKAVASTAVDDAIAITVLITEMTCRICAAGVVGAIAETLAAVGGFDFAVSAKIAIAVGAAVVALSPAIVIPIGPPPVARIPLPLAITFIESLPVVAVHVLDRD